MLEDRIFKINKMDRITRHDLQTSSQTTSVFGDVPESCINEIL